jgi:L-iditol 2-dehydrogenase
VKALRLHGVGDLRLHDEEVPTPAEGEVLLQVTAVGLCGSDRHWFTEGAIGDATLSRPLVLGHEFVGTVESGSRAGERVAVEPANPCGRCRTCLEGLDHLCLDTRFAGHGTTDGALRELMTWPSHLVYPISDLIPDVEGTLLEPLGVALHALDLGRVRAGSRAGVYGCGPVGLLLVLALLAAGADVVAFDPLAHRLETAVALGAAASDDPVDVAFEVAGEDDAVDRALSATRPGGRVVLVGIPDGDRMSFSHGIARRKGLTLLVSRRMTAADLPRAIRLVESGRISLDGLVTERYDLMHGSEAFQSLVERRGLKVVVEPGREAA